MFGNDGYGACSAGGWGMGMMMIMMLVWVVLIVLGIYALIKWISNTRPPGSHERLGPAEKSALQILEESYAKGEISREDFLQKRDDLSGKPSR